MPDIAQMMTRQRVLADFGELALRSEDLDEVLSEACRQVGEALGTGRAKILEIVDDGRTLFVRAGVGWREDVVGQVRLKMHERSSETFSITAGEPVISQDIAREDRFDVPEFMKAAGVVALVNVPIRLPGGKAFGLLQVDSTEPRRFDHEDTEFLRTYATILGPVIDRLRQVRALRATEERFQLIVENARDYAIFITDAEDRITDWLPGAQAIFGWTAEEALGQPAAILFTPEDRAARQPENEFSVAAKEGTAPNVRWHQRKDGSRVFIDGKVAALRTSNGELVGFLKIGQDVTVHRQNEERQAFLLRLSDALRPLVAAAEIRKTACRLLGEQLHADRVYYVDYEAEQGYGIVAEEFRADGMSPLTGRYPFEAFRSSYERVGAGHTWIVRDVRRDEGIAAQERDFYIARRVVAWVDVPLLRGDEPRAVLCVVQTSPRAWTDQELDLIQEAADRLWPAVERARAETALRQSEERLRQFGEASQDVLWIRDAETLQWAYLTPAFEAIYGLAKDEALAGNNYQSWLDMILADDRPLAMANIDRVRTGARVSFDYRIRRPADGTVRWLRDTDFPIRDEGGRVALIGGIGHDMTDLHAAEQRLQTLMEGIPQLVWRAVDTGEWTWTGPQWTEFTGLSPDQSRGLGWLEGLHPDDRAAAMQSWEAAAKTGHLELEMRIRRAETQQYCWFQSRARPVRNGNGAIVEWLGTSTDINDMRELQDRQHALVGELQHRTRNLIGIIRSTADKTARSSADLADFRSQLRDRLAALSRVQGLLSRLNEYDRVTFDELIGTELAAMDGDAERVVLDGPVGIRLRSSMVQTLAMGLHELATNALKYGALAQPSGRLEVTWFLEHESSGGEPWLHIDWRERGVEMPASGVSSGGTGQGRELIEQALPYQLGARTSYSFEADGVHCIISVPISASTFAE